MFEKERFIEDCRAAVRGSDAQAAIRELVARAVSAPSEVIRGLGEPTRSGIETLYRGEDLTILNLSWGPQMHVRPHDHRTWAVIGIYGGCEENTFFRRREGGLTQHGTKALAAKECVSLGASIIHAVHNPLDGITSAIHVYGGDFFAIPRSEWSPETFEEQPYNVELTRKAFEDANERLAAASVTR
jgi:predicted metal-dependent enzyme (double-stranded beta helix superfamily)